MTITIKETGKEYQVELFAMVQDENWADETRWENMNIEYIEDELCNPCEMSQAEFDEWVDWWQSEVEDYNEREYSEAFGEKNEDAKYLEFELRVK